MSQPTESPPANYSLNSNMPQQQVFIKRKGENSLASPRILIQKIGFAKIWLISPLPKKPIFSYFTKIILKHHSSDFTYFAIIAWIGPMSFETRDFFGLRKIVSCTSICGSVASSLDLTNWKITVKMSFFLTKRKTRFLRLQSYPKITYV